MPVRARLEEPGGILLAGESSGARSGIGNENMLLFGILGAFMGFYAASVAYQAFGAVAWNVVFGIMAGFAISTAHRLLKVNRQAQT